MTKRYAIIAFSLTLVLNVYLIFGCTINPPEIASISSRLIFVATDDKGGFSEQLSLMVSARDKDGVSDIEHLYILNDQSELFWELDSDSWIKSEEGEAVWIGHNSLGTMDTTLPRGEYRIVLIDKAGERTEDSFFLRGPILTDYEGPSLKLSGNSIIVDSPYSANTAFFFDAAGNVSRTAEIKTGRTDLEQLWPENGWRKGADYLAIYAYDQKSETGYFSWKIRLPD